MKQQLKFKKLRPTAKLPTKGSEFSAGYDLYLAEDLDLEHVWDSKKEDTEGNITLAKFGVSVEIPEGYCGLLVERSSNCKRQIFQANKIGIIDSDYRGEIMAPYYQTSIRVPAGERIAQLVVVPVFSGEPVWTDSLEETKRGEGGFGSTGTN